MLKGKRGMEAAQIVIIIITIVSFMLIAGAVTRTYAKAEDKEAEVLCRNSIDLRARTMINVQGEIIDANINAVPVLCKTIVKKVTGEREKIKEQIADSMARCWWMFHEGRYEEILQSSSAILLPSLYGFEEYENQCFTCYTLLVDAPALKESPITAEEMMVYLSTNKYSKAPNWSYLDYIQRYGGPGRVAYLAIDEQEKALPIETGRAYSVSIAPKLNEIEGSLFGKLSTKVGFAGVTTGAAYILGTIVTLTGPVSWLVVGVASTVVGLSLASGINDVVATFYGERDVSSIYFDTLESAQQHCGSGDIAGK